MQRSPLDKMIRFSLDNKLVIILLLVLIVGWGILVAPFDWKILSDLRDPVPVDAIPDIGENQQIVFTKWEGRSPQDVEDQISYPLTVSLLGIAGVKSIRSYSMMGFSSIYVIFNEDVEFYWSRSRILEKLNSLAPGTLPDNVQPNLGPDATALGQVFWYTLEGRDKNGNPTGGWDLHEIRSVQDYYVRYALMSAEGVSEVASIGGFVQEYQIDVDPDKLRAFGVKLQDVVNAVRQSNQDVGARTLEINNAEFVVRGIGFVKSVDDLQKTVVAAVDNSPIFLSQVAEIGLGPALRRGVLDKEGAEAVGGVVVVRYGENPLATINKVKEKIAEIAPGLPQKRLADGTESQLAIVPFYDRTGLIYETLATLQSALVQQILITIIVVMLLVMHFQSSLLISGLLPIAVLMSFISMKLFHVDANIVALSGIAIAIGTMVDMGIVMTENIIKYFDDNEKASITETIYNAAREVSGAILTAVSTTVISFLPVFTLQAAEGKLFRPLAFTKTFALIASVIVALTLIPVFADILYRASRKKSALKIFFFAAIAILSLVILFAWNPWIGFILLFLSSMGIVREVFPDLWQKYFARYFTFLVVILVTIILGTTWKPIGEEKSFLFNLLFITAVIGLFFMFFHIILKNYSSLLTWLLAHKKSFLTIPFILLIIALFIWQGFGSFVQWMPRFIQRSAPVSFLTHTFPGLGREFMPSLDEGSFLWMPTTMPHASIGEVTDVLKKQDMAISALPEIENAVGKLGRADTPLDPAPISMIETVIHYKEEWANVQYAFDPDSVDTVMAMQGHPVFAPDGLPYQARGVYLRDDTGALIPQKRGRRFRHWRPALDPQLNPGRTFWPGINSPDDIWQQITRVAHIPGTTSAPKLQPIETRIVMLQSGMLAPMGIKVKGPDLQTIEKVALEIESLLKQVPSINPATVQADRVIGKPYLEIHIDREKIARYGIYLAQVQDVIQVAIGGKPISRTVEGRERYSIRVRYLRELRNSIEDIENILVAAPNGAQIPLGQLADITYVRGPQMIKSEDTFLTAFVIFDKQPGWSEVDVVQQAQDFLDYKQQNNELLIPAGVNYTFAGSYENQLRAHKRLALILPVSLFVIFLLLYFKFRDIPTCLMIFSGVAVAWAGGFLLIWLYGQQWFFNFSFLGVNLRELLNIHAINLSVAIWVGFLALFGIATDDGVLIATFLEQSFHKQQPKSKTEIQQAVIAAGEKRVRSMIMTTATTLLALLPVLTSTGRGSDIMIPMAIPAFGGMFIAIITMFVVPVLYSIYKEIKLLN